MEGEGRRDQLRQHGPGCPVHSSPLSLQHFPLPIAVLASFQGDLKDGFEKAVVKYDMLEPCEFPSLG